MRQHFKFQTDLAAATIFDVILKGFHNSCQVLQKPKTDLTCGVGKMREKIL